MSTNKNERRYNVYIGQKLIYRNLGLLAANARWRALIAKGHKAVFHSQEEARLQGLPF